MLTESEASECEEVEAKQVRIHDSTAQKPSIQRVGLVEHVF